MNRTSRVRVMVGTSRARVMVRSNRVRVCGKRYTSNFS
jgi:hypothetical protein